MKISKAPLSHSVGEGVEARQQAQGATESS